MATRNLQQPTFPRQPTEALFLFGHDRTLILCATPLTCPRCGQPHTIFVNRDGSTVCCECDEQRRKA
jgi:hypothetical protein